MKTCLILLIGASTCLAATTIPLKKQAAVASASNQVQFSVDERSGQAWVSINTYDSLSEVDEYQEIVVPGLAFRNGKIVYKRGSHEQVCATVKKSGWGIFEENEIQKTGNCVFEKLTRKERIDNGFEVEEKMATIFNLSIR